MTHPLTPEARLRLIETHLYTLQSIAEALDGPVQLAHLGNQETIGFIVGLLADRLRSETDAMLALVTQHRGG